MFQENCDLGSHYPFIDHIKGPRSHLIVSGFLNIHMQCYDISKSQIWLLFTPRDGEVKLWMDPCSLN